MGFRHLCQVSVLEYLHLRLYSPNKVHKTNLLWLEIIQGKKGMGS